MTAAAITSVIAAAIDLEERSENIDDWPPDEQDFWRAHRHHDWADRERMLLGYRQGKTARAVLDALHAAGYAVTPPTPEEPT